MVGAAIEQAHDVRHGKADKRHGAAYGGSGGGEQAGGEQPEGAHGADAVAEVVRILCAQEQGVERFGQKQQGE